MNTETTENIKAWVFYDAECELCRGWVDRLRGIFTRHHFALVPLQTPWVRKLLGLDETALFAEMRVRLADGQTFGGADAVVELARRIWWAWPLWLVSWVPGVLPILRMGYRRIAANRNCARGNCSARREECLGDATGRLLTSSATNCRVGKRGIVLDFLPLVVMIVAVLCASMELSRWVFMWLIALALFLGFKWPTWRRAHRPNVARSLGYLLLWPGMDADQFLNGKPVAQPAKTAWIIAAAETFCGLLLVWLAFRNTYDFAPTARAWVGMVGIVMALHFGAFHLLALAWQRAGLNAKPLMRAPMLATSLTDFWGVRWNTAFHELADKLVFRPVARWGGAVTATMVVFVISGLVHDFIISVPARGGYGLPTGYFVLQGARLVWVAD